MSISALSQIKRNTVNSVYSQNGNSNKFTLKSSCVEKEIQALEEQLKKGQISPEDFEEKKNALENLPHILFTSDGGKKLSASNATQIDNKETKKEIDNIEKKYALGDMSEFAYRANMHLMTVPIPEQENLIGQKLSFYA